MRISSFVGIIMASKKLTKLIDRPPTELIRENSLSRYKTITTRNASTFREFYEEGVESIQCFRLNRESVSGSRLEHPILTFSLTETIPPQVRHSFETNREYLNDAERTQSQAGFLRRLDIYLLIKHLKGRLFRMACFLLLTGLDTVGASFLGLGRRDSDPIKGKGS